MERRTPRDVALARTRGKARAFPVVLAALLLAACGANGGPAGRIDVGRDASPADAAALDAASDASATPELDAGVRADATMLDAGLADAALPADAAAPDGSSPADAALPADAAAPDGSSPADAGLADAGVSLDSGLSPDALPADALPADALPADALPADALPADASAPDAAPDAAAPDAAALDAAAADSGPVGVLSGLADVPDAPAGQHYSYAPAAVDLGGGAVGYWSCFNADSGVVRDSIAYFDGTGGSRVVLGPSPNPAFDGTARCYPAAGQDSVHVCDPAIVAGRFHFSGVTYGYAMFYTGSDCYVGAIPHNQVFVAFAPDLTNGGTWTKYTDAAGHPIPVLAYGDYSTPVYGLGQPSATSVTPGVVILIYSSGTASGTATYRRVVDLTDLDAQGIVVVSPDLRLTDAGLTALDGTPGVLNNADFAYDGAHDVFVAVRDRQSNAAAWFPANNPSYLSAAVEVAVIPGANVWGGGGRWTEVSTIDPSVSGWPRNHNAGLVRNVWGGVVTTGSIGVVFTVGCDDTRPGCATFIDALWTNELWRITSTY